MHALQPTRLLGGAWLVRLTRRMTHPTHLFGPYPTPLPMLQTPGLAVVLVGERKDSQTYVRNKKKACEEVRACRCLAGRREVAGVVGTGAGARLPGKPARAGVGWETLSQSRTGLGAGRRAVQGCSRPGALHLQSGPPPPGLPHPLPPLPPCRCCRLALPVLALTCRTL